MHMRVSIQTGAVCLNQQFSKVQRRCNMGTVYRLPFRAVSKSTLPPCPPQPRNEMVKSAFFFFSLLLRTHTAARSNRRAKRLSCTPYEDDILENEILLYSWWARWVSKNGSLGNDGDSDMVCTCFATREREWERNNNQAEWFISTCDVARGFEVFIYSYVPA